MNESNLWLASFLLLATIGGDARAGNDFIGRDNVSIREARDADRDVWRELVVRDRDELRQRTDNNRDRISLAMILITGLFLIGFIFTALQVRQNDIVNGDIKHLQDQINYLTRYMTPMPPWLAR